jgi:hypothetical protein
MSVCVIGLIPWTVYLGLSLPSAYRTDHWNLAWVGFDVLLLLAMAATAYLGWRGRQAVIAAALATATLLVCDAWFDIALDLGSRQVWVSLASAVFVELPLAAFLAHRARMILRLTIGRLYAAAGNQGQPPPLHKMPLLGRWESEVIELIGREPGDR